MTIEIRRLSPGDESILAHLAREDAHFDLEGRSETLQPLDDARARAFLADPAVLFWVAQEGEEVVGFVYGVIVALRSGEGREVLLYEIGVHKAHRRQGVGKALMHQLEAWTSEAGIKTLWVLADNPGAVSFYKTCAYVQEAEQPVYLTRELG